MSQSICNGASMIVTINSWSKGTPSPSHNTPGLSSLSTNPSSWCSYPTTYQVVHQFLRGYRHGSFRRRTVNQARSRSHPCSRRFSALHTNRTRNSPNHRRQRSHRNTTMGGGISGRNVRKPRACPAAEGASRRLRAADTQAVFGDTRRRQRSGKECGSSCHQYLWSHIPLYVRATLLP